MRWARRTVWIALLVALLVAGHLFVARNSERIAIDYVGGRFEQVAVWVALLASFAAGAALATLLALARGARLRLEARRYRKATRQLESEVHQLRNLPLAGEAEAAAAGEELLPSAGLERGT
jgi:uncharacterized integral membrane protein